MPIHSIGNLNGDDLQDSLDNDDQEGNFEFPVMNYGGATFIDPTGRPWKQPVGEASFPWHYRNQRSPSLPSQMPDIDWSTRFNTRPMQTALPQDVVDMVVPIVEGNKPKDRSVLGTLPGPDDWIQEDLNQPNYEQTTIFSIDGISGLVEGLGDFVLGLGEVFGQKDHNKIEARAFQKAAKSLSRRYGLTPQQIIRSPDRRIRAELNEIAAKLLENVRKEKAQEKDKNRARRRPRKHVEGTSSSSLSREALNSAAREIGRQRGLTADEVRYSRERNIQESLRRKAQEALQIQRMQFDALNRRARDRSNVIEVELNAFRRRPRPISPSHNARTKNQIMSQLSAKVVRLMKMNGIDANETNIQELTNLVSRQWMAAQEKSLMKAKGVVSNTDAAKGHIVTAERYIEKEINL